MRDNTRASCDPEASTAAHERAVMTVRLTLLLLIVGVALFLTRGGGGVLPSELGPNEPAARHEQSR